MPRRRIGCKARSHRPKDARTFSASRSAARSRATACKDSGEDWPRRDAVEADAVSPILGATDSSERGSAPPWRPPNSVRRKRRDGPPILAMLMIETSYGEHDARRMLHDEHRTRHVHRHDASSVRRRVLGDAIHHAGIAGIVIRQIEAPTRNGRWCARASTRPRSRARVSAKRRRGGAKPVLPAPSPLPAREAALTARLASGSARHKRADAAAQVMIRSCTFNEPCRFSCAVCLEMDTPRRTAITRRVTGRGRAST